MFKIPKPPTARSVWDLGPVTPSIFGTPDRTHGEQIRKYLFDTLSTKGGKNMGEAPLKKDTVSSISSEGYRLNTGAPKSTGMFDGINGKVVNEVDGQPTGPTGPNYLLLAVVAAAAWFIYKRFN